MGRIIDLSGKQFGRWTVGDLSHQVGSRVYWNCTCQCGTKRAIWGADLKRGVSKSCGCLMRETNGNRRRKHAMSFHPAYRSWLGMKTRCERENSTAYPGYGGRGIAVSADWSASFEAFWRDMGSTWAKGLSIERVDVNGNYEPDNCVWATPYEQAQNRRSARIIETPDGPMSISDAGRRYGLNVPAIAARIKSGATGAELFAPPHSQPRRRRAKTED